MVEPMLRAATYSTGTHAFADVLLNDIAGPDGNPLLQSLKLSVDILKGECDGAELADVESYS